MKLYGDLLNVIPLNIFTRLTFLKTKKIKTCCRFNYLMMIFDHPIHYEIFRVKLIRFHKYIFKIKCMAYLNLLPNHITHLSFRADFNEPINILLPRSLIMLRFGYYFDQPLNLFAHLIHLKYLQFDHCFNQPLMKLPKNLIYLSLGHRFDQPIYHLPHFLKYLKFDRDFNQQINKYPTRLTHLKFGESYNQSINNLPRSLTHLEFGIKFNQKIDLLSPNLICLKFPQRFTHFNNNLVDIESLKSLKYLIHPDCDLLLLSNVTHIIFYYWFNSSIDNLFQLQSLKYIKFGDQFNELVDKLPSNLIGLEFGNNFNQKVDLLPSNIKFIKFNNKFNQPIDSLPNSIELIKLGEKFNQPINKLPSNLINLEIKNRRIKINFALIPKSLKRFVIGDSIMFNI
jgi:hypothetical protein